MEEALREKQKHSVENLQTGAAFNQVEFRMKELAAEKNVSGMASGIDSGVTCVACP